MIAPHSIAGKALENASTKRDHLTQAGARFLATIAIDISLERLEQYRCMPPEAFIDYTQRQDWMRMREAKTRDQAEAIGYRYLTTPDDCGMRFISDRDALYLHALETMGIERVDEWRKTLPVASAHANHSLPVWSPSQFLDFVPDPNASLLGDGWVERGEWTSVVGIGGLGKTHITLWLCVCQIIGREWCGLPTKGEPQRCLFLSTENGIRRWKTDLGKMLSPFSEAERANVQAYLRILALTPDEEADLNLGNHEAVTRLSATLRTENPGLIVFDPFADMVDGDENCTSDIVNTLRTLRHVTRTASPSAAVIIIHHARTGAANVAQAGDNFSSGNFGRGSKALYSRVRCELQLAPGDRDDSSKIVLACGKANNSERFTPRGVVFNTETFAYELDPGFDLEAWRNDVSGKRTGKVVSIADVVEVVRELAPRAGSVACAGDIIKEVRNRCGGSEKTVRNRLGEACKAQYLRTEKKGRYQLGAKPLKA